MHSQDSHKSQQYAHFIWCVWWGAYISDFLPLSLLKVFTDAKFPVLLSALTPEMLPTIAPSDFPRWNMKNHTSAHRWWIRTKLYIPSQQHEESITRHVDHVPCCNVPCICSFNLDVSGVVQRSVGSNTSCECSHERKSINETVKSTSQKNTIWLTFKFNIIDCVSSNFPCVNNSSNIDEVTSFRHRSSWNLDRQRVTKRKVKQWSS